MGPVTGSIFKQVPYLASRPVHFSGYLLTHWLYLKFFPNSFVKLLILISHWWSSPDLSFWISLSVLSQFSSVAQSCPTLCDPMNGSTPGLPVHHQLLESTQTMSIESVTPSNNLILCRALLFLLPIPPSIRVFSNK